MAVLDSVDWQLLALLQNDASRTNAWLASQVGLAPSSCPERVRRLRRLGVITGIRAIVEPAALGRPLQAMLAVQLRPHSRELVDRFTRAALALPETLALYNVSGPEDYFLHVAVTDSRHLQQIIVDDLATRPEVGHCQTHLVFDRPITAPVRPVKERA
jgi:DNA-binding Lrp family transcriptional regulator